MSRHDPLLDTAVSAARAAGEVLLRWYGSSDLEVRAKARHDFVSRADHESEELVVATIRERHPDHRIVAEEGGEHAAGGGAGVEWFIDPLDGTTNFLQGLPNWCVSIGCREAGELAAGAIFDPLGGHLFTAVRGGGAFRDGRPLRVSQRDGLDGAFLATGYPFKAKDALDEYLGAFREVFLEARSIRRCGAAGMDLAWTAAGVYDGFFEFQLAPWDLAAGCLLITEAGGVVTDLDGGDDYLFRGNVVAGGPAVQPALRRAVARHADEARLAELLG